MEDEQALLQWIKRDWHFDPTSRFIKIFERLRQNKYIDINSANCEGYTYLTCAVRSKQLGIIEWLLREGANVNIREKDGVTPFLLAVYMGSLPIVQCLYSKASKSDCDCFGNSPLMIAVRQGNLEIIEFFLSREDEKIDQTDVNGVSPLFWAIRENKLDILKLFTTLRFEECKDAAPLSYAIKISATQDIIQHLLQFGVNKDRKGEVPLHVATRKGDLETVKALLACGADVNVRDKWQRDTPLIIAIRHKKNEIAKYLVDANANVCKINFRGESSLSCAVVNQDIEIIELLLNHGGEFIADSAFSTAIGSKNLEIVKLLRKRGASIDKCFNDGWNPLMKSLVNGYLEIAEFLIEEGAMSDKNIKLGAILWAIKNKNLNIVKFLIDRGARDVINEYETEDLEGEKETQCKTTPLQKALDDDSFEIAKYLIENGASVVSGGCYIVKFLKAGNFETVKLLTEHGARVNEASDCGETPLTQSVKMENFEMVKYFLSHGAEANQPNKDLETPLAIAVKNQDFRTFQHLVDCGATVDTNLSAKSSDVVKYHELAQQNKQKRVQKVREYRSGQESCE